MMRRTLDMLPSCWCWRIAVAWLLAGLLAGCQRDPPPQAEELIRPVRVQRAAPTGGAEKRTFSGTARAGAESRLSFKVGGTLDRLAVKVGDQVKRGETIATLDATDQSLQAQEAGAAVAQAEVQLRNAHVYSLQAAYHFLDAQDQWMLYDGKEIDTTLFDQ